jgi:hypothetical protein
MAEGKFATSVSCMDGRIQIPIAKWIKENHSIDFVDVITEPGIDRMVAENLDLESIKNKVGISINAHKSELWCPVIMIVLEILYLMKSIFHKSEKGLKLFLLGV